MTPPDDATLGRFAGTAALRRARAITDARHPCDTHPDNASSAAS